MYYENVYNALCENNKIRRQKLDLHRHHIVPKHSGGGNEATNIAYLTPREHQIAHFLLWKINNHPNDLRSMKMLGARLTVKQRRIVGIWCRDNKIGFFAASKDLRDEWTRRGVQTQMRLKIGIHNPDHKSKWASKGGQVRGSKEFNYWCSPEGRQERAKLGALSHRGKVAMHRPGDTSFIRVLPEDINSKLSDGFVLGSPLKTNLGKNLGPSKRRKKVTDGSVVFDCMKHAAEHYNVTVSSITHWCQTGRNSFSYI